ncbi:MAG TPA: response regulator transcription factor [Planctomycetaceae bacterium]|nr:response regulator transcription factor [Planctomycetaceae bacterium]
MASHTKRVLVVDDDVALVEAIRLSLEERGYDVVVAFDGTSGLMRAERDAPDLILLDIVMPLRSGLSVLERLQTAGRQPPKVIVITAGTDAKRRDHALAHGADLYLHKPFSMEELLAAVDGLLGASAE